MAPFMHTNAVGVFFYFNEISLILQILYNSLSRLITVHPRVLAAIFIDRGIIVHNINFLKAVTLSDLKVIRVMCRSHLHGSGSEFFVNIRICDDRNFLIYKWKHRFLSDNIRIALILRIDNNRRISKHRFRTGCRDHKASVRTYDRVADMPEMSRLFFMLYFRI